MTSHHYDQELIVRDIDERLAVREKHGEKQWL